MDLLYWFESWRTPFLDTFFGLWTRLGEELFIMAALCIIYWCIDKKAVYLCGLSFFISGLAAQTMKIIFRIPRPWVLDSNFKAVESAVPAATGYSFPSGHTQGSTAFFSGLAFRFKNVWIKAVCILLFVGVGISRMYLGVHTPLDVGVGMGIALLFSVLAWLLLRDDKENPRRDLIISIVMAVFSIGASVFAICRLESGLIELKYASDCVKASAAGLGFAIGWYVERVHIKFDTHCGGFWKQALKFVIGIAVTLAIKVGLKALIGDSLAADSVRYVLLILWVTVFYPLIIRRFFAVKQPETVADNA